MAQSNSGSLSPAASNAEGVKEDMPLEGQQTEALGANLEAKVIDTGGTIMGAQAANTTSIPEEAPDKLKLIHECISEFWGIDGNAVGGAFKVAEAIPRTRGALAVLANDELRSACLHCLDILDKKKRCNTASTYKPYLYFILQNLSLPVPEAWHAYLRSGRVALKVEDAKTFIGDQGVYAGSQWQVQVDEKTNKEKVQVEDKTNPQAATKNKATKDSSTDLSSKTEAIAVQAADVEDPVKAMPEGSAGRDPVKHLDKSTIAQTNGHDSLEVDASILDLLPPDAPPESEAHWRVGKPKTAGNVHYYYFHVGGKKISFQTTVNAAGSEFAAMWIARACWAKFEEGATKEEVTAFRAECYARLQDNEGQPRKIVAMSAKPMDTLEEPATKRMKTEAAALLTTESVASLDPSIDAPPDSGAWAHVKLGNGIKYKFHWVGPDSVKDYFQVSIKQCGGNAEACERICRACYAKFEQGFDKDAVLRYREELCGLIEETSTGLAEVHAEAGEEKDNKDNTTEVIEALRAEGRLTGALLLKGRDPSLQNSSINGIYVQLLGGFGGHIAYEKHVSASQDSIAARKVLYFSAVKRRWKIGKMLEDNVGMFAYVKVPDSGQKPPVDLPEGTFWHVFNGKESSYQADEKVRCTLLAPAELGQQNAIRPDDALVHQDSEDEASSSSSSSSSASSSSEKARSRSPPHAVPTEPAFDTGALRRGRVCAKMMVRSGVRCICHFQMGQSCPLLKGGQLKMHCSRKKSIPAQ